MTTPSVERSRPVASAQCTAVLRCISASVLRCFSEGFPDSVREREHSPDGTAGPRVCLDARVRLRVAGRLAALSLIVKCNRERGVAVAPPRRADGPVVIARHLQFELPGG
jgi:hypothetical protein